jgi:hypothetical protein
MVAWGRQSCQHATTELPVGLVADRRTMNDDDIDRLLRALSKHLAALEAVDLVVTVWRGREKLHYLNPVPLQALPARWVTTTAREHSAALAALQRALAAEGSR